MSSDPLPGRQLPARWLARMCAVSIAVSSGLLITVAALGPSAGVPGLPGALPWPVFVGHARPAPLLVAALLWLAALSGAAAWPRALSRYGAAGGPDCGSWPPWRCLPLWH